MGWRKSIAKWISRQRSYVLGVAIGLLISPLELWPHEIASWLEVHDKLASWVEAAGVIGAMAVAILVPWTIHIQEAVAADAPRRRHRALLNSALAEMKGAIDELIAAEPMLANGAAAITVQNAPELGENFEEILRALMGSIAVFKSIVARDDIDDFAVLRPVMGLQDQIDGATPKFIERINILRKHKTRATVQITIEDTAPIAADLNVWIIQAQAALAQ